MTSVLLRRVVDDDHHPWARDVNTAFDVLGGNKGGGILLYGHDGTRLDNASSLNYALDASSQAVGGLHVAVPLKATAVTAARTAANSVLLIEDAGLKSGAGTYHRFYDVAGVDYAQVSGDADGGLVLGGSGASAGLLTLTSLGATNLILTQQAAAPAAPAAGKTTLYTLTADGRPGYIPNGGAATQLAKYVETVTSILTTQGDIPYATAVNTVTRLAKGTARQGLYMNSGATAPEWQPSSRSLLTARGDLMTASAANTPARLAVGTASTVLVSDGTDPSWSGSPTLTDITLTGGAWVDFAAAVTLSQNGARTRTVTYARYRVVGKTAHVQIWVTCTNLGTAGNAVIFGALPISAARTGAVAVAGQLIWYDSSTGNVYVGAAYMATATTVQAHAYGAAGLGAMGAVQPNLAIDTGDAVACSLSYEIT